ncbi:MAG: hypothetical protein R3C01_08610 [Planctomycetaceae bacterium]
MPQCSFCGEPLGLSVNFCPKCGGNVDGKPQETSDDRDSNLPESFEREIVALLRQSQKIEAIKRYRERSRVGLKEAKSAVEAIGLRAGIQPATSGCGSAAIAFMLILGTATGLFALCR